MFKRTVLFSGLALLATSAAVQAQDDVTSDISVTVGTVLAINATGNFVFPTAGDGDYTTGYVESTSGPTLEHRSNVPYTITLAAQSGSSLAFTPAPGRSDADPVKGVEDLSILSTISGSPVNVQVGAAGAANDFYERTAAGANLSSALSARMALDYTDTPPGTYETTVVFTMVAN
jgi:spore coat protein U-like protein